MNQDKEDSVEEENQQIDQDENQEEMIKRILEESDKVEFKEFDEKQLILTLVNLDKKFIRNQELRVKFNNQPDKFMDSEVELDEEIKKLQQIATHPELLSAFIEHKGVEMLLSLLIHENNDILGDVIEVISNNIRFLTK